jgi:gp16 family phage-associated protein
MTKDPHKTTVQTQTKIDAFRAELEARGETVAEFCKRQRLDYDAMYAVLRGRSKGKRGEAHRVYVALGLKAAPRAAAR